MILYAVLNGYIIDHEISSSFKFDRSKMTGQEPKDKDTGGRHAGYKNMEDFTPPTHLAISQE